VVLREAYLNTLSHTYCIFLIAAFALFLMCLLFQYVLPLCILVLLSGPNVALVLLKVSCGFIMKFFAMPVWMGLLFDCPLIILLMPILDIFLVLSLFSIMCFYEYYLNLTWNLIKLHHDTCIVLLAWSSMLESKIMLTAVLHYIIKGIRVELGTGLLRVWMCR